MPIPTPTTPTTLLEAINELLKGIRVGPISSLTLVDANEDSRGAKQAIDQVSREVQSEGWFFNTTYEKAIDPEEDGTVVLPANTLKVAKSRYKSGSQLTQRGGKLYDPRDGKGFNIGETVYVDLVECLVFEDLSETARTYVTGTAARRWCLPKMPTNPTFQWTEDLVRSSRRGMEQEDTEQRDTPLPQSSPHFAKHRRR